ncbi:MAG: hypothetical protein ABSD11_15945 [Methylocella sp.]
MISFETVRERAIELISEALGVRDPSPEQHSLIAAFLADAHWLGKLEAREEILMSSRHEAPN